jgi:hypothetical protein
MTMPQVTIRQDHNNSLWYVWANQGKVSTGYVHEQSAMYFAEGFTSGWNEARLSILATIQEEFKPMEMS